MNDARDIAIDETDEFALEPSPTEVVFHPDKDEEILKYPVTLEMIYDRQEVILEHIQGIENAFKEVSSHMTGVAEGLADSPLGKMLSKIMGSGSQDANG